MITKKILVVDNDEVFCFIIRRLLHKANYRENVICVYNVEEALTLVSKESFDIIITDLDMPVLDGFDFLDGLLHLQQIRGMEIPATYVLTSSEKNGDQVKAMQYPMVKGYLNKPFTNEYIEEIFNQVNVENKAIN